MSFSGEQLRDATWVVIEEVKDGQWGVGGNAHYPWRTSGKCKNPDASITLMN
ncbi:MAG: hypothetical protein R2806_21620 [Saprospiraceae bacterium]